MFQAIAIIDLSTFTLNVIDVPDYYESEEIEEELTNRGFDLSNCSWGAFDGVINDLRGEDVGPPEMYLNS